MTCDWRKDVELHQCVDDDEECHFGALVNVKICKSHNVSVHLADQQDKSKQIVFNILVGRIRYLPNRDKRKLFCVVIIVDPAIRKMQLKSTNDTSAVC